MRKKSLSTLKLNKKKISNLSIVSQIKGGDTNTCCDYSCSCPTVDPNLTEDCIYDEKN